MTRWSAASTRARLTAWYVGVLLLLLMGYASATYVAVRHEFLEEAEAGPLADIGEQLEEVRTILIVGLPIVVGVSGLAGYLLAGRALVPVEASFDQLRRFTDDASHELRTPLAVIRGIGETSVKETRTASEYKEAIGAMLEEVDRLTTLADALLRLSHADAGTVRVVPESFDLGALVREVASSLGILAEERGQQLAIDAADGVSVSADRIVLREAITNVLDNAIKYSPESSTIDVRLESHHDRATVAVADRGPGVPRELRARIFDRFVRVDEARTRERGGTGLGLAIAKWAVEINRGDISVEDGASGGAVFRISLPRTNKGGHA